MRGCCKTSCLVSALMGKTNAESLKGVPLFRAGDEGSIIRNPVETRQALIQKRTTPDVSFAVATAHLGVHWSICK